MTDPVPPGYPTLSPHLTVAGAAAAIDFYERAFGAQVLCRCQVGEGPVLHATLSFGSSVFLINDEFPEHGALGPQGSSPVTIHVYVEDADAAFERAVAAGATVAFPISDSFWGDRYGLVVDPFGHRWGIATHIEDVAQDELNRRAAALFSGEVA